MVDEKCICGFNEAADIHSPNNLLYHPFEPVAAASGQQETNVARVAGVIEDALHDTDPVYGTGKHCGEPPCGVPKAEATPSTDTPLSFCDWLHEQRGIVIGQRTAPHDWVELGQDYAEYRLKWRPSLSTRTCDWPFEGCCDQKEACLKANRCLKNLPEPSRPDYLDECVKEGPDCGCIGVCKHKPSAPKVEPCLLSELDEFLDGIWCGNYDDCIKQIRIWIEEKKRTGAGTQVEPQLVTQQEIDALRTNDQPPDLDWDKVHALLEPWQEVWAGDKAKYLGKYPEWMVNAAAELFAHDICDVWSWNDYVSAAAVIIDRHYKAVSRVAGTASAPPEFKADNLFGVYCAGNPLSVPQDKPIFWEGWQRVANYVNSKLAAAPSVAGTPPVARCPKCDAELCVIVAEQEYQVDGVAITCQKSCGYQVFPGWALSDFAQFFPAQPLRTPPAPGMAKWFLRGMFSESELVDSNGLLDWERIAEAMEAYREA